MRWTLVVWLAINISNVLRLTCPSRLFAVYGFLGAKNRRCGESRQSVKCPNRSVEQTIARKWSYIVARWRRDGFSSVTHDMMSLSLMAVATVSLFVATQISQVIMYTQSHTQANVHICSRTRSVTIYIKYCYLALPGPACRWRNKWTVKYNKWPWESYTQLGHTEPTDDVLQLQPGACLRDIKRKFREVIHYGPRRVAAMMM